MPYAIKAEQFILRQFDEFRVKELVHGRFILHIRLGADSVNDRPEFFPCHSRIALRFRKATFGAKFANKAEPATLNRATGVVLVMLGVAILAVNYL